MKILYVAASPVPSKAANSVHVVKMAQALAKNGHSIELFVPIPLHLKSSPLTHQNIYQIYGVEPIFKFTQWSLFPTKLGQIIFSLSAYLNALFGKVDFVFTRCLPTAILMATLRVPVVYERHSDFGEGRSLNKIMYAQLIKSCFHKGTIVVSQALKNFFIETFGIKDSLVMVAADGSDPIPEQEYPCPFQKNSRKSIGYIGHLYKGRGIEVIAEMAKDHIDCDFHIVGGNEEDLLFWKKQLNYQSNIIFHGHVSHAETKNFMMNFDVLLAPYQNKVEVAGGGNTEKWMSPLKIFEYMSSGKPLICSDISVLKEVLHHGINCMLCPPDNPKIWSETLSKLVDDNIFANSIGENAKKDFLENYTWQIRAKRIINTLFKI
jgi:glycosyltransferase involved in cell wall biosynthesis